MPVSRARLRPADRFGKAIVTIASVVAAAVSMFCPASVSAETTSQTTVSIEVVDEGRLDVYWVGPGLTFLSDGDIPTLTSYSSPTATAVVQIGVIDTRIPSSREGYQIGIRSSDFTGRTYGEVIAASDIVVLSVDNSPFSPGSGTSLGDTVTVFSIPADATIDSRIIEVALMMYMPNGVPSDTYTGTLELVMLPFAP